MLSLRQRNEIGKVLGSSREDASSAGISFKLKAGAMALSKSGLV